MLAAEAALVLTHQPGRFRGDVPEQFPAFRRLDVQDRAQMQFARADMTVKDAGRVETVQHLAEILHIGRQTFGRHGRIFDDADGLGVTLHSTQHAQAGLAEVPNLGHFGAIHPGAAGNQAGGGYILFEGFGLRVDFLAGIPPEFDDQNRRGKAFDESRVALEFDVLETEFQDLSVHQFHGGRAMLQSDEIGVETAFQRIAMGTDHHFLLRRERIQGDGHLGDEGQCALAAREEFTKVQGLDRLVERVAATTAPEAPVGEIVHEKLPDGRTVSPLLQLRQNGI